jgi:hypothetical protein
MKQFALVVPVAIAILCAACGTSDEAVATNVRARLAAASTLDTSRVTVAAKNQVVTLTGTVATEAAKTEAVQVARQADGVRDVVDQLQVSRAAAATSTPADPSSAAAVEASSGGTPPSAGTTQESGNAVTNAAEATGDAVVDASKATGGAIAEGAKVAGDATVKGTKVAAEATVDVGKATGNAVVKGAEATASGAKKLGTGIAGAVTPDKDKK